MKGVLLVSALAVFGVLGVTLTPIPPQLPGPETVRVPTGEIDYRPEGSFQNAGTAKTPAVQRITVPAFDIMQRQVSRGDYSECVADGACKETPRGGAGDAPQTHLNWYDAQAYAAWLSIRTGERWRLPTDLEWQRAAAEGFGEASARSDGRDPGQRMLQSYEAGVSLRGRAQLSGRDISETNSLGLAGISDLVWEWTDGCMQYGTLDGKGRVITAAPYCAARIVGGQHRAVVIDFIRDASVGGCAAGLPPDFLGVRLVRGIAGQGAP
ncbi:MULTISPECIES: SUMF1/EgtB/PvdO family nonheme iron enzyme [Mameliella]|uniref:SUMF1/EgtB/PvdO family nonheme iron enzyme n=1 Tax=Mameliella TaxID=1434019 RepID=UPI000B530DFD|nr:MULTISPECIES: SUMF1/EgtB/PvdO family nonheme iron enzyme [Mameliella]OWV55038.1 NirV [Mameliella alba]